MVKILQKKLGFIPVLNKTTTGFGNLKANGIGTGMFGVLMRRVSLKLYLALF